MDEPANLGKYQVLAKIAKGGMAEVYRAKAVGIAGFERVLAVKRILPKLASEPRFIRSFIDEARIAVSLNHRNLVQVVDFGKADGELFLAMELIDGVDLKTALKQGSLSQDPIPMPLALYVIAEVAAGLEYAHRKTDDTGNELGVVHCDISPQNIMLSIDGFVKILDFGVARAGFTSAPEEKRLRGKPRYMAPEQTRGEVPTPATDVFALGIVAWELLTGRRLFDGDSLQAILRAVRTADPPRVDALEPRVPAAVADALARALSLEDGRRGTSSDLAMVFARAARDAANGPMNQALSRWLRRLFPRPELESTETQARALPFLPDGDITDVQRPRELPTPELLEERRVVVVAARIDGGSEAGRVDLRRSLEMLAFKRGAVVEGDPHLTAVFGLEVVGEDDVASAMQFALDAVELAREVGTGGEARPDLRLATRTGAVARRTDEGYALVGDAAAEVLELAEQAEPGRPLLVGATGSRASARFAFRDAVAVEVRGRRMPTVELLGPTDFDARARALHDRRGRFVGRKDELAILEAAFAGTQSSRRPICVAVVGEVGVGKSRLIAELVARVESGRGAPRPVAVAASPEARDAPFSFVGDILLASLNLMPGRGEASRAQLAQRFRRVLGELGWPQAEIDEAVDVIDTAMATRDGARLADIKPPTHLLERVTAVCRRLRATSASDRPRMLVLEDLQHADAASMAVLSGFLAPPQRRGADLVLLSAKSESDLPADRVDSVLTLSELSGTEAAELARARISKPTEDSVSVVLGRAGGNPLYIEELARSAELGEVGQPTSVHEVVKARLDRLPEDARTVLCNASVVGPHFRSRIVQELANTDVGPAMVELVEAGLIAPADGGGYGGEGEYQFHHDLIREVAYATIPEDQRRQIHARLGAILASRYAAGRDEPPAIIARHLAIGLKHRLAGDYFRAAGAAALGLSFAEAAKASYTSALEQYDLAGGRDDDRFDAYGGRAQALLRLGDHEAAGGDLDAMAPLAGADAGKVADVERFRAERAIRMADYSAAIAAADAAEAAASGDALRAGEACRLRSEAFERLGDFHRALAEAGRAAQLFSSLPDRGKLVQAQLGIGRVHLTRSDYRRAQEAYGPILDHLAQWSDPWVERLAFNHVAVIELCLGNFDAAWDAARRSLAVCERYGDRARAGDNHSVCGIILSEVGRFEEAAEAFERAISIHETTGSKWSRADGLVYAGLNDFRRGLADAGRGKIEEGLAMARTIGARYIEANALCALTETLLVSDAVVDLGRALDAAVAASEIAKETGLISAEILARSRLSQATARTGDVEQALRESEEAMALLAEQEFIEGAEEEVYLADHQLRLRLGDGDGAAGSLELARVLVLRKLEAMSRPEWKQSFAELPRTRAILGT